MMKKILAACGTIVILLGLAAPVASQQVVLPCTKNGTSCIPATTSSPLAETPIGRPNFAAAQVTVGITATQVVAARPTRQSVTITNTNTVAVYCGPDNTVTTSSGFWIPGVTGQTQVFNTTSAIWCISGSSPEPVSVGEVY